MLNFNILFTLTNIKDILYQYILSKSFIVNALDILVVWFLLYKLMSLIKGTKAIQVLKGIAVIVVIQMISGLLGLNTVKWLMDQVITYGVIATIIIFQPEIRRGLEHLGRGSFFSLKKAKHSDNKDIIKHFQHAIQYMSKRKIGALITIERETGLDDYIETGIPLEADISGELLINIFIPNTPLHDGAVIIKNNKIAAACAYLPLSENEAIPKEFGTRHRAAIGVSEVSDSVTIVVSEETGDVSITQNGRLSTHLSEQEYTDILEKELNTKESESTASTSLSTYLSELFSKEDKKNE